MPERPSVCSMTDKLTKSLALLLKDSSEFRIMFMNHKEKNIQIIDIIADVALQNDARCCVDLSWLEFILSEVVLVINYTVPNP